MKRTEEHRKFWKWIFFLLVLVHLSGDTISVQAANRVTLYIGQSKQLQVSAGKRKVTWKSQNKSIAVVSAAGKVTGKKQGNTVITARYRKRLAKYQVTVKKPYLNATTKKLRVGKTYTLKLTGAKVKNYATSNKKIATVNASGKITAKRRGSCKITVIDRRGKRYTCKITVVNATDSTASETAKKVAFYQKLINQESKWLVFLQLDNGCYPMTDYRDAEHGRVQMNPYFADFVALALLESGGQY